MNSFVEGIDFDYSTIGSNICRDSSEETFGSNESSTPQSQRDGNLSVVPLRRRPIPRKGHTKSRRGCFTCKKRKIKCQETRPMCGNCEKAGMTCEYPSPPTIASPVPIIQLQSTPTVFSIKDMQFFHHFLIKAYPHLPVGADHLWTIDIPAVAHEYEFLLHSMLGLGASHLALTNSSPSELVSLGLNHRVKAMKQLNAVLSTPPKDSAEADARFATFMVLIFQSACLPDGLHDFLTMLRGCVLQGGSSCVGSFFAQFMEINHQKTMENLLEQADLDPLDTDVLDAGIFSLNQLQTYCKPGIELEYHELLLKGVQSAYISPRFAYFAMTQLYNVVGIISTESFTQLVDKSNSICQILLSYFLAFHILAYPVILYESPHRDIDIAFLFIRFLRWATNIHLNLPPGMRFLNNWSYSLIINAVPDIIGDQLTDEAKEILNSAILPTQIENVGIPVGLSVEM